MTLYNAFVEINQEIHRERRYTEKGEIPKTDETENDDTERGERVM